MKVHNAIHLSLVGKTLCAMYAPSSRKVKNRCLRFCATQPLSRANRRAKSVTVGFARRTREYVAQRRFARRTRRRAKRVCATYERVTQCLCTMYACVVQTHFARRTSASCKPALRDVLVVAQTRFARCARPLCKAFVRRSRTSRKPFFNFFIFFFVQFFFNLL